MERKEAIEVIKKNWPDSSFTMLREALETLVPELNESEDEKIRKEIIEIIDSYDVAHLRTAGLPTRIPKYLAWLEKQGDKTAWSEDDKNRINRLIAYFEDKESFTAEDDDVYANWLKDLNDRVQPQPKREWSEEDEEHVNSLLERLESLCRNKFATTRFAINEDKEWLKSLKYRVQPQREWSEEDDKKLKWLCRIIHSCKIRKEISLAEESEIGSWVDKWLNYAPQLQWKPSVAQMASITCAVRKMKESACYDSELVSLYNDLKKLREE